MGVGQGGGETPSRIRISLFFFMTPQGFNKAVFFKYYTILGVYLLQAVF